jgi:mono/diheme cytochrome c family protein
MTFWTKSILALVLTGSAFLGLFAILELLGRKEKRFNPRTLRTIHRVNGYFFFVFYLFISYYCLKIMRGAGEELSARASLHGLLAVAAFFILCVKILILRSYRQYFSMVPTLGLGVFVLTLCTTATSAGYYFTMRGAGVVVPTVDSGEKLVRKGAEYFAKNCLDCHYVDRTQSKIGPGLKGLFERKTLPASGRPVTEENILEQLKNPVNVMPAYPDLTEEAFLALMAYLKNI